MTTIRTANISKLKEWLLGGGTFRGFNTFCDDNCAKLKDKNGNLSISLIQEAVVSLIKEFGDEGFKYYGNTYKFKIPCDKNLKILAKRIKYRCEILENA